MMSLFIALLLHAGAETAFEHALKSESLVQTQERWLQYGGTTYREVEYQGGKYYLKLSERKGEFAELDCRVPTDKPNLIQAAVTAVRRSRLFVSFLQENCRIDERGKQRQTLALDPRIGITFPDDPRFPLKDRALYVNPLVPLNLGFAGTW